MPKDEFDFEDPFELNGVGLMTNEDTTDVMCECFIEEFMRLGHNHVQLLALFRNPHFIGMNMVLEKRGEEFVKNKITEILSRWGRKVEWPPVTTIPLSEGERENGSQSVGESSDSENLGSARTVFPLPEGEGQGEGKTSGQQSNLHFSETDPVACDPTGAPIPKLNL